VTALAAPQRPDAKSASMLTRGVGLSLQSAPWRFQKMSLLAYQSSGVPSMPSSQRQKDVCDLLDADHKAVKKMFKDFDTLTESRARGAAQQRLDLAREICTELTVHAQVEEEIFYPALRQAIKETDLLAEAEVEHQTAKDLIAQIQVAEVADEEFDARVKVLGEYIDHHVKEERNEIFTKARAAKKLDLIAMRDEVEARKAELMDEQVASV
jgi:hemerythrin superfamily protein